jgi:hypothetical protein
MTYMKLVTVLAGAAVAGLFGFTVDAPAQVVSHVNVVSDKSEDISTLDAWRKTYIKDGMSDHDKALAILNTLIRYRHQSNPPSELLSHEGHPHDPLKTAHVYGYNQCCCVSGETMALARFLGYPARGRILNAHSVAEIQYGGAWHLVDGSVMNSFTKPDGSLASVDEIHDAIMKWYEQHPDMLDEKGLPDDKKLRAFARNKGWKKGPPLLAGADQYYTDDGTNTAGHHGWHSTMQEYFWKDGVTSKDLGAVYEYASALGHELNVQLRPGERITRNWSSRGIEFTNSAGKDQFKELQDRQVLGIQTKLGDRAPGRIADGTVEWNVPLRLDTLKTVALTAENLAQAGEGVIAADAGKPGVLVLRLPSSYVYVKGSADLAANVGQGGSLVVSFSDNNGLDWKEVKRLDKTGPQTIDLTSLVQRRYDYRLKFELNGQSTGIDGLRFAHDFQCSQAALPTIASGENKIRFSAGPQEGTVTIEGNLDPAATKGKQVTLKDFHPVLEGVGEKNLVVGETGQGTVTIPVTTPGDITRLTISPTYRARDARDKWQVQVSFDDGKSFTNLTELVGPTGSGSGAYVVADDVPAGTRAAQVRFAGEQKNTTALFDLRIDAHYKEPAGTFKPVKVTYTWDENGTEKKHEYVGREPQAQYTITCGPAARVKSFTMELAE